MNPNAFGPPRIVRRRDVIALLGVSAATFNRRFRFDRSFPRPLDLPDGGIAWLESDITDYLNTRERRQ